VNDRLKTTIGAGKLALVLCEVQQGVIGKAAPWPALAEAAAKVDLVGNAARLATCARRHGAPVIHCTAEFLPERFGANSNARLFGSARKQVLNDQSAFTRIMPETFETGDIVLPRFHGVSPMTGSALDTLLRNENIGTVIIVGVSIAFAITNLTMDAVNRAYQVILPADAVAGFPEDYAQQVMTHTLSMLATIATTQDIVTVWNDGARR
jgi:nicotinamidase-related amidase